MEQLVSTQYGPVRGVEADGVFQFHGIPYAAPPVGERRFRMPVPPQPWTQARDAVDRAPIPPQGPSDLDKPMGPVAQAQSEDCLTLAVSTPSLTERLPVAVWLHGGANCYNGGDLPWYDGGALARAAHVVVVNLDYRLGPLGFLHAPGLNKANLSIEDGMCALRWVRDNIAAFGGDPEWVTLFGQSAGGNAIAHILARPDSEGLFGQIVLQSASLGRGNHTLADANEVGRAVLEQLGADPDHLEGLAGRVAAFPAEEILAAADRVPEELRRRHKGMIFKPVMDAWHTPEQTAAAAAGEAIRRGIRVMTGFVRDEMDAFVPRRNGVQDPAVLAEQENRYEKPGRAFARAAAEGGCTVYKYRFDWSAPDSIYGACHCLELPFLFGNLDAWDAPMLQGAGREEMERLTATLQRLWGAFFRWEDLPEEEWPRYTATAPQVKHFDNRENPVCPEDVEP